MSIIPKPRVRPHAAIRSLWVCKCDRFIALGTTPDGAYQMWLNPKGRHPIPNVDFGYTPKAYQ